MKEIICPICGRVMQILNVTFPKTDRIFSEGTGNYSVMHAMENKITVTCLCDCSAKLEFETKEYFVVVEYSDIDRGKMNRHHNLSFVELQKRQCKAYEDKFFKGKRRG